MREMSLPVIEKALQTVTVRNEDEEESMIVEGRWTIPPNEERTFIVRRRDKHLVWMVQGATLVYRYGALPPTEGFSEVLSQMRLAHNYRNRLIEIERGRRAAVRDVINAKLSSELLIYPQYSKEIQKKVYAARKDAKADPAVKDEILRINGLARELMKSVRAASDLYQGTYGLVDEAMRASVAAPLWDYQLVPTDPHFLRWEGEGRIGVQIPNGVESERVMACTHTQLKIEDAPDNRTGRRAGRFKRLHFRVGSDDKGKPIWAVVPMILHRPLPPGQVQRASLTLKNVGPRKIWSVEISVLVDEERMEREPCGTGVVAIDLGWRKIGNELRVCAGTEPHHEFRLDEKLISSLQYDDVLKSIRKREFNKARNALVEALKTETNAEVKKRTAYLSQWDSMGRLAAFALWAKKNGPFSWQPSLEAWRYHDRHLWEWERSQGVKYLNFRKDQYRKFAVKLARMYGTLVLEHFDMREVAKKTSTENDTARANRVLAATSVLRSALVHAFQARGGKVVYVPAENTTLTCHACGHVGDFDASTSVQQTCAGCGETWDQDVNAAWNLLARYREGARIIKTVKKRTDYRSQKKAESVSV